MPRRSKDRPESKQQEDALYVSQDDGTTWPNDRDPMNLQWRLRYGGLGNDGGRVPAMVIMGTERLWLASVLAAYAQLRGRQTDEQD